MMREIWPFRAISVGELLNFGGKLGHLNCQKFFNSWKKLSNVSSSSVPSEKVCLGELFCAQKTLERPFLLFF